MNENSRNQKYSRVYLFKVCDNDTVHKPSIYDNDKYAKY